MSPKALQAIANTLVYPLEFDSKSLLLKMSHIVLTQYGNIYLVVAWKLHSYCTAFMQQVGEMQTTEVKSNPHSHPAAILESNSSP